MVRIFSVYYPVRSLVLMLGEAAVVCASFLLAALIRLGPDSYIVLNYENGLYKILGITAFTVLFSYYFDLYAPQRLPSKSEVYLRIVLVVGVLSFGLAAVSYVFPGFAIGVDCYLLGLILLVFNLLIWRAIYGWMVQLPMLRERVYVLGAGERATQLVEALRARSDWGMEVVGWAGAIGNGNLTREELAKSLQSFVGKQQVERIIVAMNDRRGKMPVRELLDVRVSGIKVEDANTLLEKINGRIEIDDLYPSFLIFSEGFRLSDTVLLARRLVSITVSFTALLLCLPLIPFIALAVKLSSPGPVLFKQERVGLKGSVFTVVKFRTMRQDAEAKTGAVWAGKNDPRVTAVGRFLRKSRLDEVPQLWNVLKGDMGFVGPRPERPEFVQWLSESIPYYNLRHLIRPGLTGWAQVRYQYGASLEEAKQKLQYDLYYIKHMSLSLDLLIMFETIKTIILRRGAQ
ncbi:MAG TPA: TIGR03013 family XrtA/PEP-CTERM system glycosyltransferase [Terriglobales bacterium]|nr:TIGR03013 family XrtA/PEP-CTERM system glycosyltransferase [Terriglobales bacterium]